MKPRILLVRHMLSASNVDKRENYRTADHAIPGVAPGQATAAGEFLRDWIIENLVHSRPGSQHDTVVPKIRGWNSPYLRTRMTAEALQAACRIPKSGPLQRWFREGSRYPGLKLEGIEPEGSFFCDPVDDGAPVSHFREDILLAEQQFGLFDGLSDEERKMAYPREWEHYEKTKKALGKMWARMPMGESRADVCGRLKQLFGSIHRDQEKHGIDTHVIVGHGTTNRAFATMWLHKRYEWMHEEKNPLNCSIRLIECGEDKGYIFKGFETPEEN